MASPRPLLIVLGAAILAGGGYYYFKGRSARATGAPEYTTVTVARGDIVQSVTATGQLAAVLEVDVGSQISGLIQKLYVDFNSRVTKGQKLAEIDPATYQQRLRQARADLASAQASHKLARLNAERIRELFNKQLVTQQELDQAEAQLAQSEANLQTREAAVANAQVDLDRCTIYSPIDGIVMNKATEEGKTVAASLNAPVLFTIANDLSKMQITAAVAEADIGSVREGQPVRFTVDAFPNHTFEGVIIQVRNAPKTTNNVVTYDTIISVDNPELKLRPGMTANVSIVVAKRTNVLRVPNAALRVRMPEGLAVAAAAPATAPNAPKSAAPAAGPARTGGQGGGMRALFGNLSPEQREQVRAINTELGIDFRQGPPTPEQRAQLAKLLVERGVLTAEQAAELSATSHRAAAPGETVYVNRTVYRLPGGNKAASPEAVTVKVGITDGLNSEIADGLKEGDVLITSVTLPGAKPATPQGSNPFSGAPRRF